jgi:hypothetical protein
MVAGVTPLQAAGHGRHRQITAVAWLDGTKRVG